MVFLMRNPTRRANREQQLIRSACASLRKRVTILSPQWSEFLLHLRHYGLFTSGCRMHTRLARASENGGMGSTFELLRTHPVPERRIKVSEVVYLVVGRI